VDSGGRVYDCRTPAEGGLTVVGKDKDTKDTKLSMLERAKRVPDNVRVRSAFDDETVEAVVAWARGEITQKQLATAAGCKQTHGALPLISNVFKRIVQDGTWEFWLKKEKP
jgi:hypothetical protein